MPGGDIAKRHRWTDGDTGAGVGATHHARRIVADGIEAFERDAVAIDHFPMGVGGNAGKGAKFAGNDANRIERRLLERCDARIGKLVGGAVKALVGVGATLKLRIFAVARGGIENAQRLIEPLGVDAAGKGQCVWGCRRA
jgi:hypothetical protein